MGIKRKISSGFVVIGIILLLSSVIAVYEFISMRKTVYNLITDNVASINSSSLLLDVTDEYNYNLLKEMAIDSVINVPNITEDTRFSSFLTGVKGNFTTVEERQMADSVLLAYTAYVHLFKKAPYIWHGGYNERRDWYYNEMYPVYMKLRGYIQKLNYATQQVLTNNSQTLTDSFYRSIMPGIVAVATGIVLVLLFNYFINFYFISPLFRIKKGIKDFLEFRKSYNVAEISDDDLEELNKNIKNLIDSNNDMYKSIHKNNL